jgi:hypothetical protein
LRSEISSWATGRWGLLAAFALEGGDAEVADADPAIGADEDVLPLHVTVDDAEGVGGGEPLRRLHEQTHDGLARRLLRLHEGVDVEAIDVLHRDPRAAFPLTDIEDPHHVLVVEPGEGPRLPSQSSGLLLGRERPGMQQLQRHPPTKLLVPGGVDGAHAAGSEVRHHDVAVDDGAVDEAAGPGHAIGDLGVVRRRDRVACQQRRAGRVDEGVDGRPRGRIAGGATRAHAARLPARRGTGGNGSDWSWLRRGHHGL